MSRSYASMATELGLEFCGGCSRFDHERAGGWERGRVHFADVRITKAGLLRFLKLAALAQWPQINDDVPWRRTYRLVVLSRDLAAALHVRIPREYYDFDRAFVLASVASIPNSERLRKQAFDWARR